MVEVELEHLTKVFSSGERKVVAVNDLSFKVKDREFMVLLGPSGCGKSTTLRLIAGLETPESGNIIFDGQVVNDLSPRERDVAMVFQNYAIYPHMTVHDNIAFPLKIRKLSKNEIDKKVNQVAELLNIKHLLKRKPSELSGGEMQRVALCRAIVREPRVFLFDEPLSNLDAKLRVSARGFIKRLQKDLGITSFYVTHDQAEAMVVADRICLLNEGVLQQIGTPEEIYNQPANTFVAGFIGSPPMNLIEGVILEKGDKILFSADDFTLDLLPDMAGILKEYLNEEITFGVRPEDVNISPTKEASQLIGEVYVYESLGNIQYVTVDVGKTRIQGVADPGIHINIKDKVFCLINLKNSHFFRTKSKEIII